MEPVCSQCQEVIEAECFLKLKQLDKFFCSEYTDKDGVKWINWGNK